MFGKRLRECRIKCSLTQQKMADSLNIALRTYQAYEGGTRYPSFDILAKMGDILDVSIDYLLSRDDFIKSRATSSDE